MDISIHAAYIPLVILCIPWAIVLLASIFDAEQIAFIWTFISVIVTYIVGIIYAIMGIVWLCYNLHIHFL